MIEQIREFLNLGAAPKWVDYTLLAILAIEIVMLVISIIKNQCDRVQYRKRARRMDEYEDKLYSNCLSCPHHNKDCNPVKLDQSRCYEKGSYSPVQHQSYELPLELYSERTKS